MDASSANSSSQLWTATPPVDRAILEEVRMSVVRISFSGKFDSKIMKAMVISGLIVVVDDKSCEIVAESTLLRMCESDEIILNFPNGKSYGSDISVPISEVIKGRAISKIVVPGHQDAYDWKILKPVKWEIQPVIELEDLDIFVFPRETFITPVGYWPASVVNASKTEVFFHEASYHEYGQYGSPAFNKEGHCVGLCFLLQCRTHTWTVESLKDDLNVLLNEKRKRVSYVSGGALVTWSEA